jgi:hypothetical protein
MDVIREAGEMPRFESMSNQPAWRGRPVGEQQRRFMGTFSGRKRRYAALLTEALDLDRVPPPLLGLLDQVTG